MSIWGKHIDAFFTSGGRPASQSAGWYDDPKRPGIQRYWVNGNWDDTIAPRPKPEPAWKQARVVVLGILIAAAFIFTVWRLQQPSEFDCAIQRAEVLTGERFTVESGCQGR